MHYNDDNLTVFHVLTFIKHLHAITVDSHLRALPSRNDEVLYGKDIIEDNTEEVKLL